MFHHIPDRKRFALARKEDARPGAFRLFGLIVVCSVCLFGEVRAASMCTLLDDFSDGLDGWHFVDRSETEAFGPGIFSVVSEALHLETTGILPTNSFGTSLQAHWTDSVTDGYLRAKFSADTRGSHPSLMWRATQPKVLYVFWAVSDAGRFDIVRFNNDGPGTRLAEVNLGFREGEDWMMEAGAVGNQLSLKAWRVGEPEPLLPQLTAVDSTFQSGTFGVAAAAFPGADQPTTGAYKFNCANNHGCRSVGAMGPPSSAVCSGPAGKCPAFWRPWIDCRRCGAWPRPPAAGRPL